MPEYIKPGQFPRKKFWLIKSRYSWPRVVVGSVLGVAFVVYIAKLALFIARW